MVMFEDGFEFAKQVPEEWMDGENEHLQNAFKIMKEKGRTIDGAIAYLCRGYNAPLMHRKELEVRCKLLELQVKETD